MMSVMLVGMCCQSTVYANDFVTVGEIVALDTVTIENVVDFGFQWKDTIYPSIVKMKVYYIGEIYVCSTLNLDENRVHTCIYDLKEDVSTFYIYPLCESSDEIDYGNMVVTVYNVGEYKRKRQESLARINVERANIEVQNEKSVDADSYEPDEGSEYWWGLAYYVNENSAKKHRYWRLFYPGYEEESIYFFAYTTETSLFML